MDGWILSPMINKRKEVKHPPQFPLQQKSMALLCRICVAFFSSNK